MAKKIKVDIDVSDIDADELEEFLADVNAARVASEEAPHADLDEYMTVVVARALQSYGLAVRAKKDKTRKEKYDAAPKATRDQVDALLQVTRRTVGVKR